MNYYVVCVGEVTPNAWNILFLMPVVSVAEQPWSRRSMYQGTTASSKVMDEGSMTLLRMFMSRMLMHMVPGARGSQMYLAVVGSWRDLMMSWKP